MSEILGFLPYSSLGLPVVSVCLWVWSVVWRVPPVAVFLPAVYVPMPLAGVAPLAEPSSPPLEISPENVHQSHENLQNNILPNQYICLNKCTVSFFLRVIINTKWINSPICQENGTRGSSIRQHYALTYNFDVRTVEIFVFLIFLKTGWENLKWEIVFGAGV